MAVVAAVEAIVDGVGAAGVEEGTGRIEEDQIIIIIMEGVMIDMVVLIEIIEGKGIMMAIVNHESVGGMIMATVMTVDVQTIIMIEEAHEVEIIICTEEQIIKRHGITVVMMRMVETVAVEMDIILVNQWQNLLPRLQKSINLHQNLSKIIPLQ